MGSTTMDQAAIYRLLLSAAIKICPGNASPGMRGELNETIDELIKLAPNNEPIAKACGHVGEALVALTSPNPNPVKQRDKLQSFSNEISVIAELFRPPRQVNQSRIVAPVLKPGETVFEQKRRVAREFQAKKLGRRMANT